MALITQTQQWYLVSTDRSNDTIQILADRLAGTNRSVNLLDTYFSWNTATQNYDRLSVSAAATLVINKAYWIYVNSMVNLLTGKVIDGYVRGATVLQEGGTFSTRTDDNGNFSANDTDIDFTKTNGLAKPIIGSGGFDILLQRNNNLVMKLYPEIDKSLILTPMTTLLAKEVEKQTGTKDLDAAKSSLAKKVNIIFKNFFIIIKYFLLNEENLFSLHHYLFYRL